MQLQQLSPQRIQASYSHMLEGGLGARTVLHCHRVLSQALSHAVKWGILIRNPAAATTPPRPERKEMKVWDAATTGKFLRVASGSPYFAFYHLAIMTGMRRAEIAGLKWDAIDLDGATISVVRTLQRIKGRGL